MIIKNAEIYTPDHRFVKSDLVIRGEKIEFSPSDGTTFYGGAPLPGETIIDAEGLLALPGLVDIHFHGAAGHDFCDADPEALRAIARYEAANGVLAICPATMTFPEIRLNAVMDSAAAYRYSADTARDVSDEADLVGINLEGPFISPDRAGAQNPEYVTAADAALFRRLQARSGGSSSSATSRPRRPARSNLSGKCMKKCVSASRTRPQITTRRKTLLQPARVT